MRHPLDAYHFCPRCGSRLFVVQDFKSKRCSDCGFQVYMNAAASCVAIIRNAQGDVLVTRRARDPQKGTLDFPGGFVDMGEDIHKALKREVMEETNLEVTKSRYLFSIPNIYPYGGINVHSLDFFFSCQVADTKEGIIAKDDASEAFFMPLSKLREEDFGLSSMKDALHRLQDNMDKETGDSLITT